MLFYWDILSEGVLFEFESDKSKTKNELLMYLYSSRRN